MNIQSTAALIAAIVTFAIGWSVVLRDRTRRPYNLFAILCFNCCLWYLANFLQATLASDAMYFISLFAGVLVPISSLRFFRAFLAPPGATRRSAPLPRALSTVAAGFFVAIGYAIVFRQGQLHHEIVFTAPLATYIFGGLCWSLGTIYSARRRTLSRVEKTRHAYLFIGAAAAIAFTAMDLLPRFPPVGTVLVVVYMYFLSQTLFRYRLLDLNELLGKMVVLSTFALILAAIYGLLVRWIPPSQSGLFFFNTLVASLVILILFEPLRTQVEGQVFKWMFRERYELRSRVEDLRLDLANEIDLREVVRLTVAALEETRRVTHAAVYFADHDGQGWDLQGHLGPRPVERVDAAARRPFVERITQHNTVALSLEQLEREQAGRPPDDPQNETIDAIARTLVEMNAGVCIPVMADEQLLGLLCLKDERLREAYATDEIDLFRGLAGQLAITLQNSKLYERMKERDRLAALGEMAAGLAHEIRNPLGAIKGAAQLLAPDGQVVADVPAETREFLAIIVEEVNRLNKVVSSFLDYARPYRGADEPLDINEVVRKTMPLVAEAPGVEVSTSLMEEMPRVKGDAEQLRQVFLNLAINAVQAMSAQERPGKLTISTATRKGGGRKAPAKFIEVRFRDTGPGIPPADMKHLFIPFFTTKEKGTGLGLPISQRIVENHGGRIEVRSRLGQGTTFTVVLPALEAEPAHAAAN